ncbi:hypothetical protein [Cupriavidus sp. EM10]|uniref:hypothetical protein n=1 Tax=Cupriavidus sp. EM10 TaxID=2839983 RepID=UPI001BFFF421|nr:hypothetical protein [Cupriavidus sp. EM10]QWE97995.1 hypothetical protein KLP38_29310 [Cupriavidus sp. EM10]
MQYGTCHFTSKQAADRYYQQMGYSSADIPLAEGNIRIGEPALREGEIAKPDEDGRYHVWAPENVEKAPAVRPSPTVSAPRRREDDRLASELELLTIEEGTIQLPSERLQCYAEIKRLIQKGGGRYDSRGYFKFPAGIDAAVILEELRCGNVVNGKKDSQSFFSPSLLHVGFVKQRCRDPGGGTWSRQLVVAHWRTSCVRPGRRLWSWRIMRRMCIS